LIFQQKECVLIDKKNSSFMRTLCLGSIEEDMLIPYPTMKDAERELVKGMVDSIDSWMAKYEPEFRKWDRAGEFPPKVIDELKQLGLFGLVTPEEYGGIGLGSMAYYGFTKDWTWFEPVATRTLEIANRRH
jgi:alkylation response protein AidB-like acyl-CoA dehydrogenase